MFMFVWLFATHQCSTRARILLTLALTLWLEFGPPGAMYASFFAGLLTAELDILATSDHQVSLPWDGFARWWRTRRKTRMVILHFILVAGMFLGSQPSEDGHTVDEVMENCFGWSTLRHAIPSVYSEGTEAYRWFWLFWASWMVMIAVKEIGWVRSIFETSIAQCKFHNPSAAVIVSLLTCDRSRKTLFRPVPGSRTSHRLLYSTLILLGRTQNSRGNGHFSALRTLV